MLILSILMQDNYFLPTVSIQQAVALIGRSSRGQHARDWVQTSSNHVSGTWAGLYK